MKVKLKKFVFLKYTPNAIPDLVCLTAFFSLSKKKNSGFFKPCFHQPVTITFYHQTPLNRSIP